MDIPGWIQFVRLLEWMLVAINDTVGRNPGVSIIIFTLIVKILTLPLTMKSIKAGRRMQEVAPLLKEVQRKYKDDKPKQQAEVMRIYQEHGVNPMGSCLPMLVQLPIFLALWQALSTLVIGVDGQPGDPNFTKPFLWVPNLGVADPFYIWPVLSAIFQFVSQRMSMPYGFAKNADPQAAMTNKIMQFMPLYLLVIYLNFSAGAVIYWTFSSIFTAVQTYFVNGFGSLAEVPGFTWLPKHELKKITPEIQAEIEELETRDERRPRRAGTQPKYASDARPAADGNADGATRPLPQPKGLWGKMMAQALAAQEAQAAAKGQASPPSASSNGASHVEEEELEDEAVETRPLNGRGGGNGAAATRQVAPSAESISRKRRSRR